MAPIQTPYEQRPHADTRFIKALLDNDHAGVGEIYTRYAARIQRFIAANNGNSDDARDVFQEALMAITRQARKREFVLTCPFEAYLFFVCRGKWLNELKRRKRAMVTISEAEGFTDDKEAGSLAEETLLAAERDRIFQHFFEQMGEICRQLLRLSWTGLSMEEVANRLGITYAYARKRKSICTAELMSAIRNSQEYVTLIQS